MRDYDDYRDEDTSTGFGITSFIVVALLGLTAAGSWYLKESDSNRDVVGYAGKVGVLRAPIAGDLGVAALRGAQHEAGAVGTSGLASADPATIDEVKTITSSDDPRQFIGRKVELRVPVESRANSVSFWVGPNDNRLLVVMERDRRSDEMQQRSEIPSHDIAPLEAGRTADIVGTIEQIPYREARYSWGLSSPDERALVKQGIYVRADTVR